MNYNKLTPEEERVILNKGTEIPFTGQLLNNKEKGTYICKRCNTPLYRSEDKFDSGCGWPSFDDEIPGAVHRQTDADGRRTEILCAHCGAHLGHVFVGEQLTDKNLRHCVNSISMNFIPDSYQTAYFAAGCFWGIEHYFRQHPGVIETSVGYMNGNTDNPTYKEVCYQETGHAEAVKVVFNSQEVTYEEMVKLFFEIHDFTQVDRQGPDIGDQYRSAIFYTDDDQKKKAKKIIQLLTDKKYQVATELEKAATFWMAENYHQNYYKKTGKTPYCHFRRKVF
ncbi:MAG: bifunctional methionine sulfoxide reductase B/A protein [Candidatus Marinimicrobia bacterium]|nr:bifunctional methionine sulfoxide reductase B/A protein [Candidatus Neomarinimicrobiota bacterium]